MKTEMDQLRQELRQKDESTKQLQFQLGEMEDLKRQNLEPTVNRISKVLPRFCRSWAIHQES